MQRPLLARLVLVVAGTCLFLAGSRCGKDQHGGGTSPAPATAPTAQLPAPPADWNGAADWSGSAWEIVDE